ncbi:MAG TPA: TraM recognition domain-containing protein [Candidatus Limnocylindrales bacterium]|nr:TraM recognition domain-containing protein [Candidatus Limnocylindrales bacterium]
MSTAQRRFAARTFTTGLAVSGAGWLSASLADTAVWPAGVMTGGLLLSAGCVYARLRPARGSNAHIRRWDRKTSRNQGTASWWDLVSTSGKTAMRRRAAILRPSLAGLPWWQRWRAPVSSYAVPLCTVGRRTVWTTCEESTLRIGIPGTGKTAELACRVIDAPGGVVVTSTAADLYQLTALLRARRGPVRVFNPSGIGNIPSTLCWSPLSGCHDPVVAARRATDLMGPASDSAEGERWAVQGRRVLAVLLHAAALGGYRLADVHAWVSNPDSAKPVILQALQTSPRAAEMIRAAQQAIAVTPRTRDGVMMTIVPALAWVTQPTAAACGDPDPDESLFAVPELTDHHAALYLLGDDDGVVAPLVGALTAEIACQARALAALRPGGRLDPGLTLALDEIALVCPTPLDRWMAELRKRSIVIHAACQGMGQLRQRWGTHGASMILNAAPVVLLFGGCKDPDDLALFATLIGERPELAHTWNTEGQITSSTTRMVPVITAPMLASLPNHHALLVRRGMPVALATTPIAWRRRDVRRAGKPQPRRVPATVRSTNTPRRAITAAPVPSVVAAAPSVPHARAKAQAKL